MNRLEMARHIEERLPVLVQREAEEWKHMEMLRRKFVRDYAVSRIPVLTLDEYVIGKGSEHRSFCYRVERELDRMGRILGTPADRFGVYYGGRKNAPARKYQHSQMWGDTAEEAFTSVKKAIVELLRAAESVQMDAIRASRISPLFKGKLLYLYFPQKFAPIYSLDHLNYFAAELNLIGPFKGAVDIQTELLTYRASWPQLADQSECLYMSFLYDVFGYPSKEKGTKKPPFALPLLEDAVSGADFIELMPSLPGEEMNGSALDHRKLDYLKRMKQLERIGDRGEAVVVALERERLTRAGAAHLARKVDRVSERDDSLGYDIHSFEEDGADRFIEVKATSAENLNRGFYISANELKRATGLGNYYVYLVFSALSKKPRVLPVKQPDFRGNDFVLDPVLFHVSLPIEKKIAP
jgi:Domain of unknown function (DUF3883)